MISHSCRYEFELKKKYYLLNFDVYVFELIKDVGLKYEGAEKFFTLAK